MANNQNSQEITRLPEAHVVSDDDLFPMFDAATGEPQRVTGRTLKDLAGSGQSPSGSGLPGGASQDDALIWSAGTADWDKLGADNIAPGGLAINSIFGNDVIELRNLAAEVTRSLVPTGGTSRQVLAKHSSTTGDTEWITLPAPGGANDGLNQAAVDARVVAGTKPFARDGNSTKPDAVDLAAAPTAGEVLKAAAGGGTEWGSQGLDQAAVDARVAAGVKDFAEAGSSSKPVPSDFAASPAAHDSLVVDSAGTGFRFGNPMREVAALPSDFEDGELVFYNGDFYVGTSLTGLITIHLTQGNDPDPRSNTVGFHRGEYGSVAPDDGWIERAEWQDTTQLFVFQFTSHSDPDTFQRALLGNQSITSSFSDVSDAWGRVADQYTYQAPFSELGFQSVTEIRLTLAPGKRITFWKRQDIGAVSAADWAQAGNADTIPLAKFPATIARTAAIPTTFAGASVTLATGNFDGNLDSSVDDVQALAQAVDDLQLSTGGVNEAAVKALIADWAETGNTDRIPEAKLPAKLDEVYEELAATGWIDEGNVGAEDAFIGTPRAAKYSASEISGIPYAQNYNMSPANVNWWIPVRVPDDKVGDTLRIYLDEGLSVAQSAWEEVAKAGGYTYYQAQAANLPVAIYNIQRYEEAFLSGDQVDARIRSEVADWAETGNTDPIPAGKLTNAAQGDVVLAVADANLSPSEDAALDTGDIVVTRGTRRTYEIEDNTEPSNYVSIAEAGVVAGALNGVGQGVGRFVQSQSFLSELVSANADGPQALSGEGLERRATERIRTAMLLSNIWMVGQAYNGNTAGGLDAAIQLTWNAQSNLYTANSGFVSVFARPATSAISSTRTRPVGLRPMLWMS